MTSPRKLRTPTKEAGTPSKLVASQSLTKRTPRSKAVPSPYAKAKKLLSVSAGETLVGRDVEKKRITTLVQGALEEGKSLILYVYGAAGTGKTLTVNTVIQSLELTCDFKLINVNCMSIETVSNFYRQVAEQYPSSPKKQKRNTRKNSSSDEDDSSNDLTRIKDAILQHNNMTVMILDEIDQLKSKQNEVLRNIFQLPELTKNKLILIGISNALNFTTANVWIKELDKSAFYEMRFMPYNKEQIAQIIDSRLKSGNDENTLIDQAAINFCAMKISSLSGDIRKALDVCRQAVDMIETRSRRNTVKALDFDAVLKPKSAMNCATKTQDDAFKHVNVSVMMSSINKVYGGINDKLDKDRVVHLPIDQQLILCTLLLLGKYKSMREVKLSELRQYLGKICIKRCLSTEGKSEQDILAMCQLLSDSGYVSIKNESPLLGGGRSPGKMSPRNVFSSPSASKKRSVTLALRLDPTETEQLLNKLVLGILSEGSTMIC
ncbi:PREDICTED: cell division control protein 6 homolog [Rhagoletis zephyria]|uniref:cell division control protein 6 homolog n=1 Tax=Rhagoletis zephyria TaxID=28612 RepID=UPI00081123E0|nr:PREDICTED: cell division control protein 6 homolog [Rhagoletis zephyria]